jgi:hypothetical protein
MYRLFLCAAAALLVATAVPSAAADPAANLRGLCALQTGDEAIAACSRLIALYPNDAFLYAFRGNA